VSGLVIIDTEDASAGFRVASDALGVRITPPEHFLHPPNLALRKVAVAYFSPMAKELLSPLPGALVFPRYWPAALPPELRRPLERTALTLGARLISPPLSARGMAPPSPAQPPHPISGGSEGSPRSPPTPFPAYPSFQALPPLLPGEVPPFGAGRFAPGVALIVGERSGVSRRDQLKHRLPFVTFAGDGIGPWLCRQLEQDQISEKDLYWVNAYDAQGVATAHEVVELLKPRVIVAMGSLAERWCCDAGASFVGLLSPQEWRQSNRRKQYPLGQLIRSES